MTKKVILAGATGLIGKKLYKSLENKNYTITIITTDKESAKKKFTKAEQILTWDEVENLSQTVSESYAIINLAGASLAGKRWTKKYKEILVESRISTTQKIIDAIKLAPKKPDVLINASAVGYYGTFDKGDFFTENDPPGNDFLAKLCNEWEREANQAQKFGVRTVVIRSGVILDKNEGALPKLLEPFYFYLGGTFGNGNQPFPWIHIDDEVGIILFALENADVKGPVNAVAPQVITNKNLSHQIGKILKKPCFFQIPTPFLKLVIGEASTLLTNGSKVSSEKILNLGYGFKFPTIEKALEDILLK